jgi:predicted nucleic acid-binding protein
MGLILDTDQLIPVEKRGMTALEAPATLGAMQADEEFAISVITIAELRHGAERAVTASQRLRRESFLKELMLAAFVQPVTAAIALRVGTLDAQLEMQGQKLALPDLIIACTALEMGFGVATKNTAHFGRIPELRLVTLI